MNIFYCDGLDVCTGHGKLKIWHLHCDNCKQAACFCKLLNEG